MEPAAATPCDECPFIHPSQANHSNSDLIKLAKPSFACTRNIERRDTMERGKDGSYSASHRYIRAGDEMECAGKVYFLANGNTRWRKPGK